MKKERILCIENPNYKAIVAANPWLLEPACDPDKYWPLVEIGVLCDGETLEQAHESAARMLSLPAGFVPDIPPNFRPEIPLW